MARNGGIGFDTDDSGERAGEAGMVLDFVGAEDLAAELRGAGDEGDKAVAMIFVLGAET